MSDDRVDTDEKYALDEAAKWAARILDARRRGMALPEIDIELPLGSEHSFQRQLRDLTGESIYHAGRIFLSNRSSSGMPMTRNVYEVIL